jgi:hypothetical protein
MAAFNPNLTLTISVRYRIRFFKRHGIEWVRLTMWSPPSRKKTHNDFEATPRLIRAISKFITN